MTVIDASVLTAFVLGAPVALAAVSAPGIDELHAPEVIELETLNALRRLERHQRVSAQDAGNAVADLGALKLIRYPHAQLRERVWDLRHELTAYDASYLALAEMLPDGMLLTADRGLAARARRSLGEAGVHLVE